MKMHSTLMAKLGLRTSDLHNVNETDFKITLFFICFSEIKRLTDDNK